MAQADIERMNWSRVGAVAATGALAVFTGWALLVTHISFTGLFEPAEPANGAELAVAAGALVAAIASFVLALRRRYLAAAALAVAASMPYLLVLWSIWDHPVP